MKPKDIAKVLTTGAQRPPPLHLKPNQVMPNQLFLSLDAIFHDLLVELRLFKANHKLDRNPTKYNIKCIINGIV